MDLEALPLIVEPMQLVHLPSVMQIEQEAFSLPWPESSYRYELTKNELAHYHVLRSKQAVSETGLDALWRYLGRTMRRLADGRSVLGYGGFWLLYDEAHISTLAVQIRLRRQGLGELLLNALLDEACRLGAIRATLEVRVSNGAAQALYAKYGFDQVGRRKAYYTDNREDALILTTPDLNSPAFQKLVQARRDDLFHRLAHVPLDKILQMH